MTIHDHGAGSCPPNRRAMELATTALHAAMAGDTEKAVQAIQAIDGETGSGGLMDAILGWCDTYAAHLHHGGRWAMPAWKLDGSDTITGPEGVPVEFVWAGRLIIARANDDQAAFIGLVNAVPQDSTVMGDHIWALLSTVALSLRQLTS